MAAAAALPMSSTAASDSRVPGFSTLTSPPSTPRGNRKPMEGRKFSMKKPGFRIVQCSNPASRTRSWTAALASIDRVIEDQRLSVH